QAAVRLLCLRGPVQRLRLLGPGARGPAHDPGDELRHERVCTRPYVQPEIEDGMNDGLLQGEDLRLHYRTTQGVVQAVDGVTFTLGPRQALAVLGESGCGKSSLARAIL